MSVLSIAAKPKPRPTQVNSPVPKLWTVPEFHKLWTDGLFEPNTPILVFGEIYVMAIPGPPHNKAVGRTDYRLKALFGPGYWVRIQMPLVLGLWSDPVPDVSVIVGPPEIHDDQPTTAVLVVEVSDTTLAFDTGDKADMYAGGGITDYWVIDTNNRCLIVHRDIRPDPVSRSGASYATVTTLQPGQSIAPLAVPQSPINVSDLLP
jgi:Uma2 family endonuclease